MMRLARAKSWSRRNRVSLTVLAGLGLIGLFAIAQGGFAILALSRFGASFEQIAQTNLPALIAASELSELSQTLVATAPELALADTQIRRQAIADRLSVRLASLTETIDRVDRSTADREGVATMRRQMDVVATNLKGLNELVRRRIDADNAFATAMARLPALAGKVRSLTDRAFVAEQEAGAASRTSLVEWSAAGLQAISQMQAVSAARDNSRLDRVRAAISELIDRMDRERLFVPTALLMPIGEAQADIANFGLGDASIIEARRGQIETASATQAALRLIQQTSGSFVASVSEVLGATQRDIARRSAAVEAGVSYFNVLIPLALLICVAAGIAIFVYVKNAVITRLNRLRDYMSAAAEGRRGSLTIVGDDEITEMARATQSFVTRIEEARDDALNNLARVEAELQAARVMQLSMVPALFLRPTKERPIEIYAKLEPARTIAGDFYEYVLFDQDQRLFFLIADVSGKGIPAALFMAMTKEIVHDAVLRFAPALDEIMAEVNRKTTEASFEIPASNGPPMFVTAFAGIIELNTGEITYTSAGHDAAIVLGGAGGLRQLTTKGGPPLGAMHPFPYPIERGRLEQGEVLLLYTDGITEAQNSEHMLYSLHRLTGLLTTLPVDDAACVVSSVLDDLRRFATGAEQADDITMLALRRAL